MAILRYTLLVDHIVEKMQQQAVDAGTNRAEIDVSGGIDSAVVAALSCEAFGPKNVIGVFSSIHSSNASLVKARLVADKFEFKMLELDLSDVYATIVSKVRTEFERLEITMPEASEKTVYGSLRSCLRAPVGRFINRCFGGGMRQGTGNRDEDELLRFYQKGGDGEVDCNWIAGLYKSEVWDLARHLGVPSQVISATPTPELWGENGQTDEDELADITGVQLTYRDKDDGGIGTIEWVTRENDRHGVINKPELSPGDLVRYSPKEIEIIIAVRKMERATRHKAQLPPSLDRKKLEYENIVV